ncbi:unnamed protein product [Lampetra planeri]
MHRRQPSELGNDFLRGSQRLLLWRGTIARNGRRVEHGSSPRNGGKVQRSSRLGKAEEVAENRARRSLSSVRVCATHDKSVLANGTCLVGFKVHGGGEKEEQENE